MNFIRTKNDKSVLRLDGLEGGGNKNCIDLECLDIVADPANKMIETFMTVAVRRIEATFYRSGHHSLHIVRQTIYDLQFGIVFRRFHPFYEAFNDIALKIISSGIVEHLMRTQTKRGGEVDKKIEEDLGPQVLTMDHLDVAFLACITPLILAVLAFVVEIVAKLIKIIVNKIFYC